MAQKAKKAATKVVAPAPKVQKKVAAKVVAKAEPTLDEQIAALREEGVQRDEAFRRLRASLAAHEEHDADMRELTAHGDGDGGDGDGIRYGEGGGGGDGAGDDYEGSIQQRAAMAVAETKAAKAETLSIAAALEELERKHESAVADYEARIQVAMRGEAAALETAQKIAASAKGVVAETQVRASRAEAAALQAAAARAEEDIERAVATAVARARAAGKEEVAQEVAAAVSEARAGMITVSEARRQTALTVSDALRSQQEELARSTRYVAALETDLNTATANLGATRADLGRATAEIDMHVAREEQSRRLLVSDSSGGHGGRLTAGTAATSSSDDILLVATHPHRRHGAPELESSVSSSESLRLVGNAMRTAAPGSSASPSRDSYGGRREGGGSDPSRTFL